MLTLDQIVEKIMTGSGLNRDEVMAKIKEMREELHGFVTPEGAASVIAHGLGVSLEAGSEPDKPGKIPETIYAVLAELGPAWGGVIPIREVEKAAEARGILEHTFSAFIEGEIKRGNIHRPTPDTIALTYSMLSRSTEKKQEGSKVVGENDKILEQLAEEEAKKQRGDFPADWEPKQPGDVVVGKVERIDEVEYEFKKAKRKSKVVELTTADGKCTVWLSRTVLAKEFERKDVKVGDRIAIKFLGKPEGKTYYDYVVAVER